MKKTTSIISNGVLLFWYFLAMIGVSFNEVILVKQSFQDDWLFMVIPLLLFVLFIYKETIGKVFLLTWLSLWLLTQFLSHEWYTLFGSGFMGSNESKIVYFSETLNFVDSETHYVPDVYHIVLHVLIIVAIITTAKVTIRKNELK